MIETTAAERLIDKLEAVKSTGTNKWIARCPGHDDGSPSLSVTGISGRALVYCFAGCQTPDIVSALNLTMNDLFDSPRELEYRYDNGRVAKRYYKDGKKGFSQTNTDKAPELFKLEKVRQAVAAKREIYVCEGEEDVRALESLAVVATTAPQGAGNWHKADYTPLVGAAAVFIVADLDKAGEDRARGLSAHLAEIGVNVAGVLTARAGNDAADHVAAGFGLSEFEGRLPDHLLEVTNMVNEPTGHIVPPANMVKTASVTAVTDVTDFREEEGGSVLLDEVRTFLSRFIAYPSTEAAVAHTIWVAHAHMVEAFENTPRLAFLSPEPGSGKSRCMELTEALVPRAVLSVNASVAYIFRKISDEAGLPTLLMDEIDAVFSGNKGDGNEDLRGLLNSGYRRGASAGRAAIRGKEIVTEEWPSYCAVALAGLNQLPDTLMTRSIVINMKRRKHDQTVEPYRRRVNAGEAEALYARLADFATRVTPRVSDAWPDLPEGIEDRDADIWEPILAIADAAGGHWPSTARDAAIVMVADAKKKPATLGIKLLADIRTVMGDKERISSNDLLAGLIQMETAPWGSIKGEAIDSRFLARTLNKYEISTNNTVKIDGIAVKGYQLKHFFDAFDRYLPPLPSTESGYTGNSVTEKGVEPIHAPGAPEEVSSPEPAELLCRVCGLPMHPSNAVFGTHPNCDGCSL